MKWGALAILLLSMAAFATVKFPYPQAHTYGNNTIIANFSNVCTGVTPSSLLKTQFNSYLTNYYTENGNFARIKFDQSNYTVSEGIGYGMIFMVYFSDNTTSYQSQFNKLWNYYQNFVDGNGLMNWKIEGFNSVNQSGGATDADEDVAFALAMAYYQWGDVSYKTAAANLIAKIRSKEFSSSGLHYPGDQWSSPNNPSYVSPAAYEIFKLFDAGNSSFWSSAISANYTLLQNNQNSTTGLPSGWCDANGNPQNGNNTWTGYDYDASRAPWRWAWSYAWYGHSQAGSLLAKLSSWVSTKVVTQLKINMKQDGSDGPSEAAANGTSIGSLSSSLIYNSAYQDKLNSNFQSLMLQSPGYYHSSLRLLTGLLMSGNMQNLATATPVTQTSSSSSSLPAECIESSSSAYVNSGAYGWESETVALANESPRGVDMMQSIDASSSRRWVTKVLGQLSAGITYSVSLQACESADAESQTVAMLLNSGTDCDVNNTVSPNSCITLSCSVTPSSNENDTLNIWMWSEGSSITVSDLLVYGSDGDTLVAIPDKSFELYRNVSMLQNGSGLSFSLPVGGAQITLMDLQGRVLRRQSTYEKSATLSLNSMARGSYVVLVRSGYVQKSYRVHVK